MLRTSILFLVIALRATLGHAADDKTALIEQVLQLTRAEQMTKVGQLEGFKMGIDMAPAAIPADKKAKIIAAGKEIIDELMPWSAMKKDFVELYNKHYTVEELKTIIELCKDPKYNILITKQIEMIGPSMKVGQKYGKLMMPRMMQATMKIMQEK